MADSSPIDPAPAETEQQCSIARALAIVGDRWTVLILRDAFRGVRRFDDFRRDLDIARPVLAERLRKLVDAGVLTRHKYQDRPARFEYRLTEMGRELSPALVALMHWGDRYLTDDSVPRTVLTHKPCGHEFHQGFYCPHCREVFTPAAIGSKPGGSNAAAS